MALPATYILVQRDPRDGQIFFNESRIGQTEAQIIDAILDSQFENVAVFCFSGEQSPDLTRDIAALVADRIDGDDDANPFAVEFAERCGGYDHREAVRIHREGARLDRRQQGLAGYQLI